MIHFLTEPITVLHAAFITNDLSEVSATLDFILDVVAQQELQNIIALNLHD